VMYYCCNGQSIQAMGRSQRAVPTLRRPGDARPSGEERVCMTATEGESTRNPVKFGQYLAAAIRYIAALEGTNSTVIEGQVGQAIKVTADTIRRYKAGHIPPTNDATFRLARACLELHDLPHAWTKELLEAA